MIFKSKYIKLAELLQQFSIIFNNVVSNHGSVLTQLIEDNKRLEQRIDTLERKLNESSYR